MTARRTLDATARRGGDWWLVHIPELDTTGQAQSRSDVQDVANEVAALYLDVPESDVDVRVRFTDEVVGGPRPPETEASPKNPLE